MEIPQTLRYLLEKHQSGGITESDCLSCSSGCCSRGGFAIIENVLAIYELYKKGLLQRKGMNFPEGLSLRAFIVEYFDVWERHVGPKEDEAPLIFFHAKSIDEKGRPISIPGDSYWEVRDNLFNRNRWLNHGCVFLSHPVLDWPNDDHFSGRHCILHQEDSLTNIGPKPIDCLFYTCLKPYEAKFPVMEETVKWLYAIAKAFPNSKEKIEKIMNNRTNPVG
jgi:hypothetical protein